MNPDYVLSAEQGGRKMFIGLAAIGFVVLAVAGMILKFLLLALGVMALACIGALFLWIVSVLVSAVEGFEAVIA